MAPITVRYFAAAADAAGREEERWSFAGPASLGALRAGLAERYGDGMRRVLDSGSFLVDGVVRCDDGEIGAVGRPADDPLVVDVLPAFAGG
ncbi:MoaD/ThiS family protein [Leucobacter allii]|uniref:MoaD/ThiS family protein n=1 Tax=Leucobacter allii TaxID=2932247 RepID=A0ABY4FPM3_9MICO|nr:MoaD/ThiS family protein [Leucobacter allii]UOQ58149.1 MoaD/ThiS family protein [Leucobacter allii]UOR02731.1 MoaD/ThiS family protein [Leucobacter allii]